MPCLLPRFVLNSTFAGLWLVGFSTLPSLKAAQPLPPGATKPFYAVGPSGDLIPLPEVTAKLKRFESRSLFLLGGRTSYVVSGDSAPFRLKEGDPQVFTGRDQVGPFQMVKLQTIGGRRQWVVDRISYATPMFAWAYSSTRDTWKGIPLNQTPRNSREWQVEPQSPLAPGNYALGTIETQPNGQYAWYLFSVEGPSLEIAQAKPSKEATSEICVVFFWCRRR